MQTLKSRSAGTAYASTSRHDGSPIDCVLSRLERVKRTGPDRWVAQCPAHDDRRPSLSIRKAEDHKVPNSRLIYTANTTKAGKNLQIANLYKARIRFCYPLEIEVSAGRSHIPSPEIVVNHYSSFG